MILDKINNIAVFYDSTPKNSNKLEKYAYSIYFVDEHLELQFAVPENECEKHEKTLYWLTEVFFPKIFNWALNEKGSKSTISSLSHVSIKMYFHVYNRLKIKYAQSLIDVSAKFDTDIHMK